MTVEMMGGVNEVSYEYKNSSLVKDRLKALMDERFAPVREITSSHKNALRSRLATKRVRVDNRVTPIERMQHCRKALERLDTAGWKRSYHQRLFHDDFLVSLFV